MNNLDDKMSAMMQLLISTAVDVEKFGQGNKSAGTRIRGAMQEIKSIAQDVRVEVQEIKNAVADNSRDLKEKIDLYLEGVDEF